MAENKKDRPGGKSPGNRYDLGKEGQEFSRTRYTKSPKALPGKDSGDFYSSLNLKSDRNSDRSSIDTPFPNRTDKMLMEMRVYSDVPYTTPQIYRGKQWFIHFYYRHPETMKRVRIRLAAGLNWIKDLEERELKAQQVASALLRGLRSGKVPAKILTEGNEASPPPPPESPPPPPTYAYYQAPPPAVITSPVAGVPMVKLLRDRSIIEGRGKSEDTKKAYRLMLGRLQKFLAHIERPDMDMLQFDYEQAEEFKGYLLEEMDLANVSVNCTIQPIKRFLDHFRKKRDIPGNPFADVNYLPKHRGSKFIPFDAQEKKVISETLKGKHPELYLFSNLIYSCFLRPKEICTLTPGDIDLNAGFIMLRVENAKVSHTSYRQILPHLSGLLREYNIMSMPKRGLIFQGICGDDTDPRVRRRRVSTLWQKVIKEGLSIDKDMYGLKHTGNIDYLKSLEDVTQQNLLWLKNQNDHTSLETTQRYIQDLGIYKMKTEKVRFGVL